MHIYIMFTIQIVCYNIQNTLLHWYSALKKRLGGLSYLFNDSNIMLDTWLIHTARLATPLLFFTLLLCLLVLFWVMSSFTFKICVSLMFGGHRALGGAAIRAATNVSSACFRGPHFVYTLGWDWLSVYRSQRELTHPLRSPCHRNKQTRSIKQVNTE